MNEIVIVTGFGRCGSTMLMRMLEAGGIPPACDSRASYELNLVALPNDALNWRQFAGKAVKVLDPQRWYFPPEPPIRFIFLSRDAKEQAKSQAKFFGEILGRSVSRDHRRRIEVSLRRDYFRAPKVLQPHPALFLQFEKVLREPYAAARQICGFLKLPLDDMHMGQVVLRRPSSCAPDLSVEYAAVQAEMAGAA